MANSNKARGAACQRVGDSASRRRDAAVGVRVAAAQINAAIGDFTANSDVIVAFSQQAYARGAAIVVFPEMALCGYPPEDLVLKPQFVRDAMKALRVLARRLPEKIVVVVGCLEAAERLPAYNAAAIIQQRVIRGFYRKRCLPNYGVFDEQRHFRPGPPEALIGWPGVRFGVTICEDMWIDNGPAQRLARQGAHFIINCSASPYHYAKHRQRLSLVRRRANENSVPVCYVNMVGGQDELIFDGASFICDAQGRIMCQAEQFAPDLVCADIPLPARPAARPPLGVRLQAPPRRTLPPLAARRARIQDGPAEVYQALMLGVADYVRKNSFQSVVIGLSGGVDSALVAAISADALGADRVHAVTMPSRYSSAATLSDAEHQAKLLGISLRVIPIQPLFSAYEALFGELFAGLAPDATEENIQARIRGNLLMALSNKFGWLVLTTGNKSETSVGYCTLYGDMAGGFAVIKDVPKTLIYELCRYRNSRGPRPIILESILTRPPSAELRDNQTDQDSLPPYAVLDQIVQLYVEADKSYEQICRAVPVSAAVIKDVITRIDRNEYKRRQAPPGIKITPKAYGRDRRMPITSRYRQFESAAPPATKADD